jgi:hypothetical protein
VRDRCRREAGGICQTASRDGLELLKSLKNNTEVVRTHFWKVAALSDTSGFALFHSFPCQPSPLFLDDFK